MKVVKKTQYSKRVETEERAFIAISEASEFIVWTRNKSGGYTLTADCYSTKAKEIKNFCHESSLRRSWLSRLLARMGWL